eukprot:6210545-Pleurochrysis_carterae.AAC.1
MKGLSALRSDKPVAAARGNSVDKEWQAAVELSSHKAPIRQTMLKHRTFQTLLGSAAHMIVSEVNCTSSRGIVPERLLPRLRLKQDAGWVWQSSEKTAWPWNEHTAWPSDNPMPLPNRSLPSMNRGHMLRLNSNDKTANSSQGFPCCVSSPHN